MTCSPFDLKEYLFGELNADQRESVDRHLLTCAVCQDELAGLSATRSAILCMHEEEPPRRIAFVSDKVFEPRWWQKIFASGPQLGFASAATGGGCYCVPRRPYTGSASGACAGSGGCAGGPEGDRSGVGEARSGRG